MGGGGEVGGRKDAWEVGRGGGGKKGGERGGDIRMNHGAFPWGELHFVTT